MPRAAVLSGSPMVRAGLRSALEDAGGFSVVATARSMAEMSVEVLAEVDVVVADVEAIGDEGLIGAEVGPPLVVLLGQDDSHPAEWLLEGASVLAHDASAEAIAAAACAAAAGLVASSRELVVEALRPARPWPASSASPYEALTAREMQVLEKLALGLGNKAIGESLHISTHTAKFHVAQIIAKLEATSRAHAVAKALRGGLLQA